MNTPDESTATDTRPGEVRTYRGRTVEELIPRIRAELGPGAMILRERQGLTGGVGGFFAKRCVEIDAQAAPRLSVYADDDADALTEPAGPPAAFAGAAAPSPPIPEANWPSTPTLEATMPNTPTPEPTMPSTPSPQAAVPSEAAQETSIPTAAAPETTAPPATATPPHATVPVAGMPHVSRPGTPAPGIRTTPDPFAALLARWEEVA
ncbi:MAG: hypothetical protein ACRDK8_10680, partial [Solirubrobacteraceae bacterium]